MKRSDLIRMLKSLMGHGFTLQQVIELLEKPGRKRIGRLKEKMVVEEYERRGA